ncbi:hypothetical protein Thini_3193 [Thiothrix nivea DSM 5205]|uniref:Uncharacterized protein n=1 Tax=Thiothrix nivea (strain ATCC 35100 / DSM 5205 / JP2) TaxID=870187 RepID=A0A656HL17_THINJ|nr:hypothetical protein Thini_3193 [Thiothrix nivea DSM 5205]
MLFRLEIFPILDCLLNVGLLAAFVATTQENDKLLTIPPIVDAVARAHIDTQFTYTIPNGFPISNCLCPG